MNKTPIQNLARIKTLVGNPPPLDSMESKKKRTTQSMISDPEGLAVMNELVELKGSLKAAADSLHMNTTNFSLWKRGEPIRKAYAELARFVIAEHKAKIAPKIVLQPKQHTAIVTLSNEHKDDFRAAVESVGGQYTILTYPNNGE